MLSIHISTAHHLTLSVETHVLTWISYCAGDDEYIEEGNDADNEDTIEQEEHLAAKEGGDAKVSCCTACDRDSHFLRRSSKIHPSIDLSNIAEHKAV